MARVHRVETRLDWQEYADLEALCLRRNLQRATLLRHLITKAIDEQLFRDEIGARCTRMMNGIECLSVGQGQWRSC